MSHYTLPKRYHMFLSVLLIITFDVKLNYFYSAIHLCGPTRLHCGATAFFEANIKLEQDVHLSVSWEKVGRLVRTQINIDDKKYWGSNDTRLIINNVCKEDEGRYQAVISLNQDVKIFSNEVHLHLTGGIQSFWKFLLPETCFVPFLFSFCFVIFLRVGFVCV